MEDDPEATFFGTWRNFALQPNPSSESWKINKNSSTRESTMYSMQSPLLWYFIIIYTQLYRSLQGVYIKPSPFLTALYSNIGHWEWDTLYEYNVYILYLRCQIDWIVWCISGGLIRSFIFIFPAVLLFGQMNLWDTFDAATNATTTEETRTNGILFPKMVVIYCFTIFLCLQLIN